MAKGDNQYSGKTNIERFIEKFIVDEKTGCFQWTGAISSSGRSSFSMNGKAVTGHRFSYIYFRGSIPIDKELDHLCVNPKCVNPWHLEAVDKSTNIKRGWDYRAENDIRRQKTHCKYGHLKDGQNLRINPSGTKVCKECDRARSRKYWRSRYGEKRISI